MNAFNDKLNIIRKKERKISFTSSSIIEESYQMILLLKDLLLELKTIVLTKGFKTEMEEIYFFKIVKPEVLGKLIYYNKVYRIETGCPVNNGKLFIKYFTKHLEQLKTSYKEYVCNSDFYKYYKSKRTDLDSKFFRLNQIDLHGGLNSIVFEIDEKFSTYYDYKVSRIISNDLLYEYLIQRMDSEEKTSIFQNQPVDGYNKDVFWTDSKNALVELIYALHASGAVSNGRVGISKMSMVFEIIFRVKLGDLHHSFHRMKDRSGSKTAFLDHLKANLEKYMDKDL
ncbi:tetracycline regulation of excision, RteC [Paenimyroides tangerinum]|uniref:Tetracycline regulation of excision, RteC n=1 Tax=Paenimyroides tangerinum TaxID=2488728 RepID=A0A3P3W4T4_9FLAO|nr:RteC domain-containing protein [Paenimyroides tangerinum]RRJ89428.1 tetracycline regulation of excision, RteC [Paenimyroides tangerinum]